MKEFVKEHTAEHKEFKEGLKKSDRIRKEDPEEMRGQILKKRVV